MAAWYNDNEPFVCEWLRNLIKAGLIPDGDVDNRSIRDVRPEDLRGYTQCHFFAGIGGWAYALRLAGWPDDRPVWTGSCPCQPFSSAGNQKAFEDERHLWPAWFNLIRECRPATIFGEQVTSGAGPSWLGLVRSDLEAVEYALAAMPIEAACVGARQLRDRYWIFARPHGEGQLARPLYAEVAGAPQIDVASSYGARLPNGERGRTEARPTRRADAHNHSGRRRWAEHWRAQPEMVRLVHGVPARVGCVRAYGNAIVPQVATEFIRACMTC